MSGSLRASRRGFVIAALVVTALVLTGCMGLIPSPKTMYTDEHGETVTVDWRDFPSITGTDVNDVLEGPTVEDVEERADEVLASVREAVGKAVGKHVESLDRLTVGSATGAVEWNTDRSDALSGSHWFPGTDNGYGGRSMLQIYNSPVWELGVAVPLAEWDGVLDSAASVLEGHGFLDRYEYPYEPPGESDAQWAAEAIFSSGSEFVSVVVSDAALNPDVLRDTEESGLTVASVTVLYGASAIKESDREEFALRAAPFAGLEHPNATT